MNSRIGKRKATDLAANPEKLVGKPSRHIPESIKREVRQRCGFGCVICGLPLYEYEHMNEWAIVKKHVAADMTLLCDRHHREKTNGLLSVQSVRDANASPCNLRGKSEPYPYHIQASTVEIRIANNIVKFSHILLSCPLIVLSISCEPILWFNFENGNLLLNLTLYDKKNNIVAKIRNNELVYTTTPWDITFIGKTLTIKSAERENILTLTVSPNDNVIAVEKGTFRYDGYEVFLDNKGMHMPASNNHVNGCVFNGSGNLVNYGGKPMAVGLHIVGARSY